MGATKCAPVEAESDARAEEVSDSDNDDGAEGSCGQAEEETVRGSDDTKAGEDPAA